MGAIPLTIQPATSVRSAVIPVAGASPTCFSTRTKVALLQLCCSSTVIPVAGASPTCFTTRTKVQILTQKLQFTCFAGTKLRILTYCCNARFAAYQATN